MSNYLIFTFTVMIIKLPERKRLRKDFKTVHGELAIAQQFRALDRTQVLFPASTWKFTIPVPGDLMPSSGICGHTCDAHIGKTLIQIK